MITTIFKGKSFCGFFTEDDLAGKINVFKIKCVVVFYYFIWRNKNVLNTIE